MPPQNYGGQSGYDYDQQHHYQRQQDQQHHDPYNQRNPYDRQQDYNTWVELGSLNMNGCLRMSHDLQRRPKYETVWK